MHLSTGQGFTPDSVRGGVQGSSEGTLSPIPVGDRTADDRTGGPVIAAVVPNLPMYSQHVVMAMNTTTLEETIF